MPAPTSNLKILLTALLLILYPHQTTLLALLTLLLRLTAGVPGTTPDLPGLITIVLDTLAKLLLQAATLVLGGYSALRAVRVVLIWGAHGIDASLAGRGVYNVLRAGVLVVLGEVVVLISRWAAVHSLDI